MGPTHAVMQPNPRYTVEDQERMTRARRYFAWQSRLAGRELGRRVVEIGCGLGNFTETLLDRELVVALDAEPACIERLRERYPGRANLHAIACEAPSPCFAELRRFEPDSCVCLNVLEHIADDVATLRAMAAILPPGGRIVLLVPAFPSLYGPIDRDLGHYRRYRRGSLRRAAETAGLTVKKLHYLNTAGFFAWWANSHIFRRHEQSPRQIAFFDDFVVPVMSRAEDLISPPFGQSLFAVLERS
ncbi:MAG TPA: class I SAM-dependent methyltransferase [Bryobacteraceae bacterium]|nr:class I SAM-dependent methyltransferase [Bryobacteraceae bacterium]